MKLIKLPASLSQPALQAKQVQFNETEYAKQHDLPMYCLMERAGAAAFSLIGKLWPNLTDLLVVCGKGNNGGDGLVLARLAHQAGIKVIVLVFCQATQYVGDALIAYTRLSAIEVPLVHVDTQQNWQGLLHDFCGPLIVDCLFGSGFRPPLPRPMLALVEQINQHNAQVLSLDIPSALAADTGHVAMMAINADVTLTFVALKQGLMTGQAANHVGTIYLDRLGVETTTICPPAPVMIQGQNELPLIPAPLKASHKGILGSVLAIGGNLGMPGAIRLAAEAALRCGAGGVAVCCHLENQTRVFNGRPELMLAPCQASALAQSKSLTHARVILIGPGLGRDAWAQQLFSLVVLQQTTCVIDADALHLLADLAEPGSQSVVNANWVLTPHPGEAASLLGCSVISIEMDRFAAVRSIAQKYGGICVLKGAGSLISDGKSVWINTSGNPGMASAGMGDVLSGTIAAMLLQMPNLFDAARLSAYLHGRAADIIAGQSGQRGMLASDLLTQLRSLVNNDFA